MTMTQGASSRPRKRGPSFFRALLRSGVPAFAAMTAGCVDTIPKEQREYPTIVSLNPCTDAILAEVADPAQLLAISHYSHDPRATSMPLMPGRSTSITNRSGFV